MEMHARRFQGDANCGWGWSQCNVMFPSHTSQSGEPAPTMYRLRQGTCAWFYNSLRSVSLLRTRYYIQSCCPRLCNAAEVNLFKRVPKDLQSCKTVNTPMIAVMRREDVCTEFGHKCPGDAPHFADEDRSVPLQERSKCILACCQPETA